MLGDTVGIAVSMTQIIKKKGSIMASKFGFKRMTIRILDSGEPQLDTNVFVIEGKQGKGATQTAKISGLSADPVKSFGSDISYYTSRKGVGDVKVDLGLLDIPDQIINKILGYKDKSGITLIGADTEAPLCSILIESTTSSGKKCGYGFFKGTFSMNEDELKSIDDKKDGLPPENFTFTALASDDETYAGAYVGKVFDVEEGQLTKLKQAVKISA